jgi:Activator of Hsp90 ATPase homolog 1-like protein
VSTIQPVKKQIVVEASQQHCFRVFSEGMDRWWSRDHHIGKSPLARMVLEPRGSGRWYSIQEDGSECDIGKVILWEPPQRMVLAWQVNAQWQYDASFVTEVEVTFTAEGPKRTRVDLEHRHLDRFGEAASELRKSFESPGGWTATLENFSRAAAA